MASHKAPQLLTLRVTILSEILARDCSNAVISALHGLRIGSKQLLPPAQIPAQMNDWMMRENLDEALLSAHHFAQSDWANALEDRAFPQNFIQQGGTVCKDFVKVLLVNSFEPSLQFIYSYRPTEHLAASLRRNTVSADARIYDPNLESKEVTSSFPNVSLRFYTALTDERFDIIVQTIFNVDYDLRLLCEIKRRAPDALLIIGGPHLKTVDLKTYFRALPIDGAILGDGETPLLHLAKHFRESPIDETPGILTLRWLNGGPQTDLRPFIVPPVALPSWREPFTTQHSLPNIWGLASYESRDGVLATGGKRVLPYDIIGLNPVRILTSQRCSKACYWCKSPKRIAPIDPDLIVQEIELHFDQCDSVHFEDNEIWFAPDNFYRIGQQLIARKLNDKPMLVKTTTDQITESRVAFMRDAGICIVAFGVESFTQESLDLLNKGTTVEQNHKALDLVLDAGIKAGINAIWLVPGIDLAKTREFILSVIPYLKRGAYLNLVPELDMGDVKMTRFIDRLANHGYFRNEPRQFPGMHKPLDFIVLNISEQMSQFKQAVLKRVYQTVAVHQQGQGSPNVSIAVWSLYLLLSIIREFPVGCGLPDIEREKAEYDVSSVLSATLEAEEEHRLFYSIC